MKVFIVNNVFNVGSTGKIVYDTKRYYESCGHEVKVAYGIGEKTDEAGAFKFCSTIELYIVYFLWKLGHNQYKGSPLTSRKIIREIERFNPDIVHLHCLNSFCIDLYGLLNYLANNELKVVVTHHAEFYYTGSCPHAYGCSNWIKAECNNCVLPNINKIDLFRLTAHDMWVKMYDAFSKFKRENLVFTAVSPWVRKRANLSPITNRYKCVTVMNGLDTNIFHYYNDNDINIGKNDKFNYVVFHATAVFSDNENDAKGGAYLIELARRNPSVLFVVAAIHTNFSKEIPSNVLLWGKAKDGQELAKLYSIADVTILCSKRETFSMITAESLCCGTPVVGFEAGGPESIAIREYSKFVEYGNIQQLDNALQMFLLKNNNKKEISTKSQFKYSKEEMSRNYLKVYYSLIK